MFKFIIKMISWRRPIFFFVACTLTCIIGLILFIVTERNTRTFRTKHRLMFNNQKWNLMSGFNDAQHVKSSKLSSVPNWVPKLSRALRDSTPFTVEKLQTMFKDAEFYSWPPVNFNSTVIQSILEDLDLENLDSDLRVPNIVHLTWFYYPKRQPFRFHQVICLLSIRKFIKPDKILFWYDIEPTGKWWQYIKGMFSNILLVQRKAPTKIFDNRIRVPEHKSDVARLEAILAFGGIYMDLDVIVLNPFTPLRALNVTLGAESPYSLGNGVIVAVPNATFLWMIYYSYYSFDDRKWNYHSVKLPMKLATQYPDIIHIEWDSILRPNWSETRWIYSEGKLWDWEDNYCIHLSYRFHDYEHNPESIKRLNTTMGEVFRYIYYGDSDVVLD